MTAAVAAGTQAAEAAGTPGAGTPGAGTRVIPVTGAHAGRLAGSGGHGLVDAAAGLDGRLGVESNPGS